MDNKSKLYLPSEIHVGMFDEFEREILESDVLNFAEVSGDHNPLHVNKEYAASTKFEKRIVHGAFQVAIASEWIGMYLPGRRVLLSSVNAKFIAPLYYPTKVRIAGKLTSWDSKSYSGSAKVTITDLNTSIPTAEITMYVSLHELKEEILQSKKNIDSKTNFHNNFTGKKIILITGATGGIATNLIEELNKKYDLICQGRDNQKLNIIPDLSGLTKIQCDINDLDFEEKIKYLLGENKLYSIIHFAWPGIPKGGLLNLDNKIISDQLNFGSLLIIKLAKILSSNITETGGRFIAIGSTAASIEVANTMPAYSLGKSLVEDTVRLLVPEMARREITINTIIPSLINSGMNSQIQELVLKKLISQVPLNRICDSNDVLNTIEYLLSEKSSFITGQSIALTGGKR